MSTGAQARCKPIKPIKRAPQSKMQLQGREVFGTRVECTAMRPGGRECGAHRILEYYAFCFVCGSGVYRVIHAPDDPGGV